jgi:predicted permease
MNLASRLYGTMLRLYPREFRDVYGAAMTETFSLRAVEARTHHARLRSTWFFVRELSGLAASAAGTRWAKLKAQWQKRGGASGGNFERQSRRRELIGPVARDVHHATRRLLKSPGFTLASVVTLALGIGANTAIFSIVHGIVLNPLPFPEPDQLIYPRHTAPGINLPVIDQSVGTYQHYRKHSRVLDAMGVFRIATRNLTGDGNPERVAGAVFSASMFDVLRVPPMSGRVFDAQEDRPGGPLVVVLSERLWTRRYGADPGILGRTVQINSEAHEVIGIMPREFAFPRRNTDMWLPFKLNPDTTELGGFNIRGLARLKPGFTADDAQRDFAGLVPRLVEAYPNDVTPEFLERSQAAPVVRTLKEHVVGDIERALWILLGTVAFVLLIACANVANLFLVRAESRQREVAIRTALGAGRVQLVRYFLTESALLAILGGALGLGLAFGAALALVRFGPSNIPRLQEVTIDGTVLLFTAAVSLLTGLLFGTLPSLRHASPNLVNCLKEGGRGSSAGRGRHKARNVLVVSQVALALVLLIGAGLMARSFWHLHNVDPGFEAEGVLTFHVTLPRADYPTAEASADAIQQLADRFAALPGVRAAGSTYILPIAEGWWADPLVIEDHPVGPDESAPMVNMNTASPGYFSAMGIPVRSGRAFERADHERRTGATIVNQELAERFWPGESPIGKRVYPFGGTPERWYTIVGVTGNVRSLGLTTDPPAMIYLPIIGVDAVAEVWEPRRMTFALRTAGEPEQLVGAVRSATWSVDPNLPIANIQTMERVLSDATTQTAFSMVLLAVAAAVALLLGAVGIYGVVSYIVSQRMGEIGVRMALGAGAADVSSMVLRQGTSVAAIGIGLGLAGAFALTRLLEAMLFGVSPTDPVTYGSVSVVLLGIALLATYLPARRASHVDPVTALRQE